MRSSAAASASTSQALSFSDLRAKIEAGIIEWVVSDSRRSSDPPGTKRRFLSAKDTTGNIMMTLGDPILPAVQNPVIVNQPGPSKKNPTSKVYNALFRLDGKEAEDMVFCSNWIVESAHKNNVFGVFATQDKLRESLSLPFTTPDATGKGDYGVWVNWQMDAPRGRDGPIESLRTRFMVSKAETVGAETVPKIIRQYDGNRVVRDQPASCLYELAEFREYAGMYRGGALGRVVLIDESVALPDDAPMPVAAARTKQGFAFPYNGGYILYGTAEHPTPVFCDSGVDTSSYKVFIDIVDFKNQFESGKALLASVDIGGTARYFSNLEGVKGNPLICEGSFADPEDEQPILMKKHAPHEDSVDSNTMGALTAITKASHAAAYTAVAEMKLQQVFDKKIVGTGKRFDAIDKIRGEVALPGTEPENEGEHYFIWQKLNLEAPKDIADLQTQFFLISPPGEPWTCERIDGNTLKAGRRIMSGYEISELKRATGKWREVLYTKVVFVTNNIGGSADSAGPLSVSWGGQTLDFSPVTSEDGSSTKRVKVE